MTLQIKPTSSGFRELSPNELDAVSGGNETQGNPITVTGDRINDGWLSVSAEDLALLGIFGWSPDIVESALFGDGSGGSNPVGKVPSILDIIDLGLSEQEQALSMELQLAGVPGPLADTIAKLTGILSSYEFKDFLNRLADTVTDNIARALFGPPSQSTGDRLEDFRRTYGPILGPSGPDFPE